MCAPRPHLFSGRRGSARPSGARLHGLPLVLPLRPQRVLLRLSPDQGLRGAPAGAQRQLRLRGAGGGQLQGLQGALEQGEERHAQAGQEGAEGGANGVLYVQYCSTAGTVCSAKKKRKEKKV